MTPRAAARRDPALAAVLSAFVPGAGLLYAGETTAAGVFFAAELAAFGLGWWIVLVPLHLWQIAIAGGTASVAGERGRDVMETRRTGNPGPPA